MAITYKYKQYPWYDKTVEENCACYLEWLNWLIALFILRLFVLMGQKLHWRANI
jgi:hypothetical protein